MWVYIKWDFPVAAGRLYKPVDDELKLFDAAGSWISLREGPGSDYQQQSRGCDFMRDLPGLDSAPLSTTQQFQIHSFLDLNLSSAFQSKCRCSTHNQSVQLG